jgi:hypothetical protein
MPKKRLRSCIKDQQADCLHERRSSRSAVTVAYGVVCAHIGVTAVSWRRRTANMALLVPSPRRKLYLTAARIAGAAATGLAALEIASLFSILSLPPWVKPALLCVLAVFAMLWPLSASTRLEFRSYAALGAGCVLIQLSVLVSDSSVLGWMVDIALIMVTVAAIYLSARADSETAAAAAKKNR